MIESYDEFGAEVQLPSKKVICPRCHGEGTHVNPSIDGNGLTYEEFDGDEDFRKDYFAGRYDVVCHTCNGHNVVDVLNEDQCTNPGPLGPPQRLVGNRSLLRGRTSGRLLGEAQR